MRSEGKLGKDAIFSIRSTDVKSVSYKNDFKVRPGEKINIQVKTNMAVRMNPAQPTSAVVFVKFEAGDENAGIAFEMETVTAVSSSTYVDDFEEVIKNEYLNVIMLAVNERIRAVAGMVGFNVTTPGINFGDKDNLIAFAANNKDNKDE